MIVEEYEEESNGEVQANNDEAYNSSVYFIDLRIDDMKCLLYFFIDPWPVAATKLLIAIRGAMSAEFEKIKKKVKKLHFGKQLPTKCHIKITIILQSIVMKIGDDSSHTSDRYTVLVNVVEMEA